MADQIHARFYVEQLTKHAGMAYISVKLRASTKGDENKSWAKYTPSGTLEMAINNPTAAAWFEDQLGKDLALTFEAMPSPDPEG